MGSLLRSEDMVLLRVVFDGLAAHDTVDELGKVGVFEFEDLNDEHSSFQRHYAPYVQRCEEMQRCLRLLEKELNAIEMEPTDDYTQVPEENLRFDELESHLSVLETNVASINSNMEQLQNQYNELVESKYVLEKGAEFFKSAPMITKSAYGSIDVGAMPKIFEAGSGLNFRRMENKTGEELLLRRESVNVSLATPDLLEYTMGVLNQDRVPSFDRVLFRASRGNAFMRFADIDEKLIDAESVELKDKVVFIIFHFGHEMASKVSKICNAFQAHVYHFPEMSDEQLEAYKATVNRIKDLDEIIATTRNHRRQLLADLVPKIAPWSDYIMREKSIYHNLNKMRTDQKLFVATGWAPMNEVDTIRSAIEIGKKRSNSSVQAVIETATKPDMEPPTYFRTNKFTEVFQAVVEAYSVAQYKEMNPAPFVLITFPFLFAVMFGDMGHGIVMALVALLIIQMEDKLKTMKLDEMTMTLFDGRYIILLMGLFSIFTGLIYNEFFAVPLDIFGSRWKYTDFSQMACGIDNCEDPAAVRAPLSPYPFGFDPVWKGSQTALLFFNSYKMKLSILLGVSQMLLGIMLSYRNAKFFQEPIDVWYVFVPQMIFLNCTFGYLCIIILLKWSTNYDTPSCRMDPFCEPPDLKQILIGLFMAPGSLAPELRMFPGQMILQALLLLLAVGSVPVMLLAKPLLLKARYEKMRSGEGKPLLDAQNVPSPSVDDEANHGHGEFDLGDAMVKNMIHTIEFVLGCVSNTASYLRLWALSLAHAELSNVFLEKLVFMGAQSGSAVVMIVCFFMWLAMTIGVLMLMESLSAFLHALRLHWVEFQNKFYSLHGPGRKFSPFDFDAIRREAASP